MANEKAENQTSELLHEAFEEELNSSQEQKSTRHDKCKTGGAQKAKERKNKIVEF
jgi:hypothetical protein